MADEIHCAFLSSDPQFALFFTAIGVILFVHIVKVSNNCVRSSYVTL